MNTIVLFILGLLVWLFLSWPPDSQHLLIGMLVAGFVAFMTGDLFARPQRAGDRFTKKSSLFSYPGRYLWFTLYVIVFLWECLKANIDVALRVSHPLTPIHPGIVKIKTSLKSDTGRTFLANSITLTPGTLTVDIDEEEGFLYIHWIDVRGVDLERASRRIAGRFEPILRRIFE